jgi:hypothetical protein
MHCFGLLLLKQEVMVYLWFKWIVQKSGINSYILLADPSERRIPSLSTEQGSQMPHKFETIQKQGWRNVCDEPNEIQINEESVEGAYTEKHLVTGGHRSCWGPFCSLPELNLATDGRTQKHTCSPPHTKTSSDTFKGSMITPICSPTASEKQANNWDIWNYLLIYSPPLISFHFVSDNESVTGTSGPCLMQHWCLNVDICSVCCCKQNFCLLNWAVSREMEDWALLKEKEEFTIQSCSQWTMISGVSAFHQF